MIRALLLVLATAVAHGQDINPPVTHLWLSPTYCTGQVISNTYVNALLAKSGAKTLTIKDGCTPLVGHPASGTGGWLVTTDDTTIVCEGPKAGPKAVGRVCIGGALPGAACTGSGQCGAGTCGYDGNGAAAFSGSGESMALIQVASGVKNFRLVGCSLNLQQVDDYQRCASGHATDGGKACEFKCTTDATLACDQNSDCPSSGTCTNVTSYCAPTGNTGFCSDPPGRANIGKITAIDAGSGADVTLTDVRVVNALEAADAFVLCGGTGSCSIDRLDTTVLSRPQFCPGGLLATCTGMRPISITDTDQCWITALPLLNPTGVKATPASTGSATMSRVTTKAVTTGIAIVGGVDSRVERSTVGTTGGSSAVVSVTSSNALVARNTLTEASASSTKGVYAGAANVTVDDNSISGGGASAIHIDAPNSGLIATKNRIVLPAANSQVGIKLAGGSNVVQGNSITQSGSGTDNLGVADLNSFSGSAIVDNIVTLSTGRGNASFYAWGSQSKYLGNEVASGFIGLWSLLGNITISGNRFHHTIGPKVVLQGGGAFDEGNYRAWETGSAGEGYCVGGTGDGNWCNTADATSGATTCPAAGVCRRWPVEMIGWPRINDTLYQYGAGSQHATIRGGLMFGGYSNGATPLADSVRIEDARLRCRGGGADLYTYCASATDCACTVSTDCGVCANSTDCGGGAATCSSGVCGGGGSMCNAGACRSTTAVCAAYPHADTTVQGVKFLYGAKAFDGSPITSTANSTVSVFRFTQNLVESNYSSGVTMPDSTKCSDCDVLDNDFSVAPSPLSGCSWANGLCGPNFNLPVGTEDVTVRTCTAASTIAAGDVIEAYNDGSNDYRCRSTSLVTSSLLGIALHAATSGNTLRYAESGITTCTVQTGLGVKRGDVLIPIRANSSGGQMMRRKSVVEAGAAIAVANQSSTSVLCKVGLVPGDSAAAMGRVFEIHEDFVGVSPTATSNGTALALAGVNPSTGLGYDCTGTGASVQSLGNGATNEIGLVELDTGSTSSGRCGIGTVTTPSIAGSSTGGASMITVGSGAVYWRVRLGIEFGPLASGNTDRITLWSGLGDAYGSDPTDGCFFKIDDSTNSANWQFICCSNSSCSTTNTSTTVTANSSATTVVLEGYVNVDGSLAEGWINGVPVTALSANIPTGLTRATGFMPIVLKKTNGTTLRSALIDYAELVREFAPVR